MSKGGNSTGYHVSKFCRSITNDKKTAALIYHTFLGNGMLASVKLVETLDNRRGDPMDVEKLPSKVAEDLLKRKILVPNGVDEENRFRERNDNGYGNRVRHLRICVTENCNMKCSYCYVDCKKKYAQMAFEVAEKAIREYLRILKERGAKGNITFFGGEPLLNWNTVKKSILLIKELDPQGRWIQDVHLVSNGTLLDETQAGFLKKTGTGISISYDGPEEIHDKVRLLRNGTGTHKAVLKSLDILKSADSKPTSLVCTIGNHNIDALNEVVRFAGEKGIFLNMNDAFAEPRKNVYNLPERKLADNLFAASQLANEQGVQLDGTWNWPYSRMQSENHRPSHCVASGGEISVNYEGVIKPCPGFTEIYGTIDDLDTALHSETYQRFSKRVVTNLPDCSGCDIEGLCGGGCMLNASKVHEGDIFRKCESCSLFKMLFRRSVKNYLDRVAEKLA